MDKAATFVAENSVTEDLEYLYKEYVRLSSRLDTILDGSWGDFKLLVPLEP